jgi:Short C-terminal domain
MRIAMPSMPESLAYAVVAAVAVTGLAALLLFVTSPGNLLGAVLVLALALAIYWLVGRSQRTIVAAKDAAAATALLLLLCAVADLLTGHPYRAVLFLLAAAALGFAFLLQQQGTEPIELRLGGVVAVAAPSGLFHLRMLEELHDAGLLTEEEFAAKRVMLDL